MAASRTSTKTARWDRVAREASGLATNPFRVLPAAAALVRDGWRATTDRSHLYRYARTRVPTTLALGAVTDWLGRAQRPDGGVAAYYSLITGWAPSYPETTGYIIPTLYDLLDRARSGGLRDIETDSLGRRIERMTRWLLRVQLPSGAFPGGLGGDGRDPSVFNTGQILQGLVRAAAETGDERVRAAAVRAGDWLVAEQRPDGRWEGPATYLGRPHCYYTMVAWSLALLGERTGVVRYDAAARANLDWALRQRADGDWFDGYGLEGFPIFLHFVAYLLQGLVETGLRTGHDEAVHAAERAAWRLLRRFEFRKRLPGELDAGWTETGAYQCLTGNAQMACVWLRLYERSGDARWLNAALKLNESVKERIPTRGIAGTRGGVAGSDPIWGRYQPFRYINWGAKFVADALLGELRALEGFA